MIPDHPFWWIPTGRDSGTRLGLARWPGTGEQRIARSTILSGEHFYLEDGIRGIKWLPSCHRGGRQQQKDD